MDEVKKYMVEFCPMSDYECYHPQCDHVDNSHSALMRHYRSAHKRDKGFCSPCLYSRHCCHSQPFFTFGALETHMSVFHKGLHEAVNQAGVTKQKPIAPAMEIPFEHQPFNASSNEFAVPQSIDDLDDKGADFVLSLLTRNKIPQSTIQSIIPQIENLIKETVKIYEKQVRGVNPLDSSFQEAISRIPTPSVFENVKSLRQQDSYFQKRFGLVKPVKIDLPITEADFRRHKRGKAQHFKKQTYVYISILKQLEQLFQIEEVFNEIFIKEIQQPNPDAYVRFEDGEKFKQNAFFNINPRALKILLYLDEVQLCNPLGSKTTHKLFFVYFTILDLPTKFRSSLKSIFLTAIFYAKQANLFDLNLLLKPIIEEIKQLEKGIEFILQNQSRKVYGTLVAVVADNLASHQVGGLKAGFSNGFRKCRTCLATKDSIQSSFYDSLFTWRTVDDYESQCQLLTIATLREHFSKVYGLNKTTVLNELTYYHIMAAGLPPDIMHDLLEGIVPTTICKVIKTILSLKEAEQNLNLDELNHLIQNFKYGYNEVRDKPSEISETHLKNESLRQSSCQIWLLMTYLPIIVVDKVPEVEDTDIWKVFVDIIRISQISFSDVIAREDLDKLEVHIHDFLQGMKNLGENITAKMHNLVHYPHYIHLLGPLKPFWCGRFEGKHSFFKTLTRTTGNFINLPWTLANRHQIWLTSKIRSNESFLSQDTVTSKRGKISSFNQSFINEVKSSLGQNAEVGEIFSLSWIQVGSTRIQPKESVILCPEIFMPSTYTFGVVESLFIQGQDKGHIYVVCRMLALREYSERYQAFKVVLEDSYRVFKLSALNNLKTFSMHKPLVPFIQGDEFLIVSKENLSYELSMHHMND